jgi:flagellar biosynthesis protein FlhG
MSKRPVQVIAVTGGKGGVGKTNVSINLAVSMAKSGRRVVLMDADLGLANIDVLLGLTPKNNLADVMAGRASLDDILLEGPAGIRIIPASSGTQSMVAMGNMEHAGLIRAFSGMEYPLDVLIIDTAAGISDSVISFVRAAQEILLVVCDEPSSITDAYALMKLMCRDYQINRFKVLANMTHSEQEGQMMFNKLAAVSQRFLDVTLQYLGQIPFDAELRRSVKRQKVLVLESPSSPAAVAYQRLAQNVMRWPVARTPRGHLEFFVENLLQAQEVQSVASSKV